MTFGSLCIDWIVQQVRGSKGVLPAGCRLDLTGQNFTQELVALSRIICILIAVWDLRNPYPKTESRHYPTLRIIFVSLCRRVVVTLAIRDSFHGDCLRIVNLLMNMGNNLTIHLKPSSANELNWSSENNFNNSQNYNVL